MVLQEVATRVLDTVFRSDYKPPASSSERFSLGTSDELLLLCEVTTHDRCSVVDSLRPAVLSPSNSHSIHSCWAAGGN
jgi:hypothetical protein